MLAVLRRCGGTRAPSGGGNARRTRRRSMARARGSERPVVSLVPHSGIQFLDLALDIDVLPKTTRSFWEERIAGQPGSEGKIPVLLRVLQFDERANALG